MCFNALRRFAITDPGTGPDLRLAALEQWLDSIESVAGYALEVASGDASFRRYFRLQKEGKSFIVMDAPPPQEDCTPFVRIAEYLQAMQLNAPRVIEADIENGFLLLSDLGTEQYLDSLSGDRGLADQLYGDAIQALQTMQLEGSAFAAKLPCYDEALLRFELSLFYDWLCGTHLNLELSPGFDADWQDCCDALVENALQQPQVFVHRDYHSRNLMVTDERNPGILDFQDAVSGPCTYDLVSLLKDCYVQWPATEVRRWAMTYYDGLRASTLLDGIEETQFLRHFELMGVQRHLKAAGIFCRLNHRDGKSAYLEAVPRTLGYIVELDGKYPELDGLIALLKERVLPLWDASL